MDNWDDYRFILALDRCGTLRSAAIALGVNHSTVSRRLSVINSRYNGPVFEQVAGGYKTTSLGKQLVDAAEKMENVDLAAVRQQKAAGGELSGPITLSVPGVLARYILLEPLIQFSRQYPDIQLTIHSSYSFADLDRSEADIAVRGFDHPPEHFVGRRLFAYGLSYYCHKDYLGTVAPENRGWITSSTKHDWLASSPYPDAPIILKIDDIELRHRATVMGQGMSIGACYIADAQPELQRIPGAPVVRGQDFWVLTHPDMKNTPRIKLLMQFIATVMMKHRALIEGK